MIQELKAHRFVHHFADIACPLTELTRKDIEFAWFTECAASFETLKAALTTTPVLQVFDDAKPSELWVDASQFAVGATLVQPGDDGKMLPVEYLSHRLSAAECNYDATDHEFVAIPVGLRHWHHYLVGTKFIVHSNHASLKWL